MCSSDLRLRFEAKKLENELSKSGKQDKDEEARLEAQLIQLTTSKLNLQKRLQTSITTFQNEVNAKKQAEIKAEEEQQKKIKEEQDNKIKKEQDLEIKRLESIDKIQEDFKKKKQDEEAQTEIQKIELEQQRTLEELDRLNATEEQKANIKLYYADLISKEEKKNEEKALYVIEKGKEVFDASLEPAEVKAKFEGGNANQFILANRLINYGVSSVQINIGGWDTHSNCFVSHTRKVGDLDKGLGGLISQLKASGKFKETLILICGEFGRTPRINTEEGRDHFARNWGAALVSGAIEKGQVFGESSKDGYSVNNGVSLDQLLYSTLELMGTPARLDEKGKVPERILPSGGSVPGFSLKG